MCLRDLRWGWCFIVSAVGICDLFAGMLSRSYTWGKVTQVLLLNPRTISPPWLTLLSVLASLVMDDTFSSTFVLSVRRQFRASLVPKHASDCVSSSA